MSNNTLNRSIGLGGAILLGLGSILGTGVFVSLGLAVGTASQWAIAALGIAALLASLNALSSAQLAANHPVSGGTYAYGYRYLNPHFGFIAGTAFLLAKSASAAAAAIGLISYTAGWLGLTGLPVNFLASLAILAMTLLVAGGLRRANLINTLLVGLTLIALLALGFTAFQSPPSTAAFVPWEPLAPRALLEAAALLFVAFTGYGRIATLGEEVTAPRRTIPRAIIATLFVSTSLYALTLIASLRTLGPELMAQATLDTAAPLQAVAAQLQSGWLQPLVAIAAGAAMAGVLLNLILGLSRVAFAMGRQRDLPSTLGQVSGSGEPLRAIWAVGIFIALIAFFGGLAAVWSFSAFTVLIYYAITNLAALQLSDEERLYPKAISAAGLIVCLGLAVWISPPVLLTGSAILAAAIGLRTVLKSGSANRSA
ncbi:MAG: APC family permease [Hyphomonadaceae bacterium]